MLEYRGLPWRGSPLLPPQMLRLLPLCYHIEGQPQPEWRRVKGGISYEDFIYFYRAVSTPRRPLQDRTDAVSLRSASFFAVVCVGKLLAHQSEV